MPMRLSSMLNFSFKEACFVSMAKSDKCFTYQGFDHLHVLCRVEIPSESVPKHSHTVAPYLQDYFFCPGHEWTNKK